MDGGGGGGLAVVDARRGWLFDGGTKSDGGSGGGGGGGGRRLVTVFLCSTEDHRDGGFEKRGEKLDDLGRNRGEGIYWLPFQAAFGFLVDGDNQLFVGYRTDRDRTEGGICMK